MDGYYAWMIVATAFVLMMTTPALALFYGGMTRSKSVLNMMMMSYVSLAVVGIVFVLFQLTFAVITAALISGAIADRV
jgi:Amt family ammonium transporter